MAENDQIQFDNVSQMECPSCHAQVNVEAIPAFNRAICPNCGAELSVPGQLGSFKLLSCLGAGGMGSVYKAYDETLDRVVAIKVMLRSLGGNPEFLESFRREAQAAAKLNHPNICQIYSFGQEKGQPYIVMELVPGKHFDEMITQPDFLDQAMVMKIGMDIADGLQLAAASNLIHGDIKPENILLDNRDVAKLVDFGIASTPSHGEGEIWGTPYYIAPEKLRRQRVDFRSDIYCLGGTLYHALTKQPPFDGEDALAVVKARLLAPPRPMKEIRPDIDPEVSDIIDRMLQLEPAMRYPTYGSLLSDMRRYLSRVHPQAPSASASTNKRVIIKGRGKGASSQSTQNLSSTSKHSLVIPRGSTGAGTGISQQIGLKTTTFSGSYSPAAQQPEAPAAKSSSAVKWAIIGVVALLVCAGAGFGLFVYLQHKKAAAESNALASAVTRVAKAYSGIEGTLGEAKRLRDANLSQYLLQSEEIVSNAVSIVEEYVGTEFTSRIKYLEPVAPEPEEDEAPDEAGDGTAAESAEGGKEGADAEAPAEGAGKEDEAKGDAEAGEQTAGEENAEAAEGGNEGGEAAEADAEAEGSAETAEAEPPLEGMPAIAREIFVMLAPVRDAERAANKAVADIDEIRYKAFNRPEGRTNDLAGCDSVLSELNNDGGDAARKLEKLQAALEECPEAIRKARTKLGELAEEGRKIRDERKRKAEEEEAERQRIAEEERKRQAEEARIAAEKSENSAVLTKLLSHTSDLQAFRIDKVVRELELLDKKNPLRFPSSKNMLKNAIKRVKGLGELKAFLIESLNDKKKPFKSRKYGGWSVTEAGEYNVKTLIGGKLNVFTWEALGTRQRDQLAEIIQFYLQDKKNAGAMLAGDRAKQEINAAVFYLTAYLGSDFSAQATEAAKKLVEEAVKRRPTLKDTVKGIFPELELNDAAEE